ncbi:MAG: peptidoglycan-binding protein [Candidatus Omnitrophica bacterium]|nr:peptidoglycan-binding protein [Candidatus Omnitrophota bacterium]
MLRNFLILIFLGFSFAGCDRIYGLLHKPGGEERKILGEYTFNEYSLKVEELQKILRLFGYPVSRVDGKFGSSTRDAVGKFQMDEGLEVTRFVDKATWERMQSYVKTSLVYKLEANVMGFQRALKKAGFISGKLDGRMGPQTRDALRAFQRTKGLKADGVIGLKTIKALLPYLEGKKKEESP